MLFMFVPFEVRAVPTVDTIDHSATELEGIIRGGSPVFLIEHAVGIEDTDLVPLAQVFTKHNLVPVRDKQFTDIQASVSASGLASISMETTNEAADSLFHLDSVPRHGVTDVNLLHTEAGEALASFFEPTEEFVRHQFAKPRHATRPNMTRVFLKGLVDDSLFAPVCYQARMRPNTVIGFRRGGAMPLGHIVQTTQGPRTSRVRGFSSAR